MGLYALLAILAMLTLISLLSSKISSQINMPCLLLFLAVGLLTGTEGLGMITFRSAEIANVIGSVALAFILFSGGFDTNWQSIKPVFLTGGLMSSIGVLLTAVFCGIFTKLSAMFFLPDTNIPFSWCLLLGAIISSTDAAAVFSILRSRSVSLKGNVRPLLEFESGSNDPMAAFTTIFMVGIIAGEQASGETLALSGYWIVLPMFLLKMSIGLAAGFIIGKAASWLYNKIDFEYYGLYYVLVIVVVLSAFSIPELLYGNGFMGVYVAGMTMGNSRFVYHNGVGKFCDGIAWLMQIVLFTMLGLLALPTHLWEVKWFGLSVALFLMFAARPLATFTVMLGSGFSAKERTLISWVGLRGGAPIMLATFPLMAQIENSDLMFHVVFFIVITSVLFQGMTIMPVAKLLNLNAPLHKTPKSPLSIDETGDKNAISREFTVSENINELSIAEIKVPEGLLILMIRRRENIIVPRGDTKLYTGDIMTVLGSHDTVMAFGEKLTEL